VGSVLLDPQVGLFQLSYFKERLSENFKRALRYNHPLTVAALRVVNYDDFAATKGRAAAADMLRQFARCLRENIRDVDIPARYDKDTFVLLLPETDEKGADVALDRITKHMQQLEPAVAVKSARYAISQRLNTPEALLEAAVSACR